MKMRAFFKTSKSKIILAIILFLLLPIPFKGFILGGSRECNGLKTCVVGSRYHWVILGGTFFVLALLFRGNEFFDTPIDYIWKIPYLVIVSYLLSCIIIYFFKRIKK